MHIPLGHKKSLQIPVQIPTTKRQNGLNTGRNNGISIHFYTVVPVRIFTYFYVYFCVHFHVHFPIIVFIRVPVQVSLLRIGPRYLTYRQVVHYNTMIPALVGTFYRLAVLKCLHKLPNFHTFKLQNVLVLVQVQERYGTVHYCRVT